MEAYKFETTVQENGVIRIPEISRFANHQVEIFIVIKPKSDLEKDRTTVANFLDKWRGALKGVDPDALKQQYLQEKYG